MSLNKKNNVRLNKNNSKENTDIDSKEFLNIS